MARTHSPTDDLQDLRAILASRVLSSSERLVLIAIVLHRNGGSGRCDPSIPTLARETGLSERSVRRALQRSQERGYVLCNRRDGRSTCYTIAAPTPDTESPRTHSHPGHDVQGPRTQSPDTPDTVSTERTKERTKERTNAMVDGLWAVFVDEMDGAQLTLTDGRRKKLDALYREQLKDDPHPMMAFRNILRAVQASDHHMSNRAYQMPESLFRSPERRERWAEAGHQTSRKPKGLPNLLNWRPAE